MSCYPKKAMPSFELPTNNTLFYTEKNQVIKKPQYTIVNNVLS